MTSPSNTQPTRLSAGAAGRARAEVVVDVLDAVGVLWLPQPTLWGSTTRCSVLTSASRVVPGHG